MVHKTIIKVCISSLYVNGKQVFVGENDDLSEFLLGNDELVCNEKKVTTPLITIQNEKVVASQCKSSKWIRNNFDDDDLSESCFDQCGKKGGKCSVCDADGNEGFCCRGDLMSYNGNCPDAAIMASPNSRYTCVHGKHSKSARPDTESI